MCEVKSGNVLITAPGELAAVYVPGPDPVRKVEELVEARQAGRVFVMPVAIGGTAWFFDPEDGPDPFECRVKDYSYSSGIGEWYVGLEFVIKGIAANSVEVPVSEFGICWFLDQSEAVKSDHSDEWRKDIHKAYINGIRAGTRRLSSKIADAIEVEFSDECDAKRSAAARIVNIITELCEEADEE